MAFPLRKQSLCFLILLRSIHDIDPDSLAEERFIALGMSNSGVLLVVVYTMRGEIFRLISARRATRREAKVYEG